MENNKKKLQIPSTCALLFMLMIVCAILTWIVPAGEFDTEKVGNLNKVIAGTYHTVDASPVGPWATIMAVVQGFYKAAKLMVMIMFVGGAVEILEKTGAIHAAFGKLASKQNLNVNVLVLFSNGIHVHRRCSRCFRKPGRCPDPDRNHPCNKLRV